MSTETWRDIPGYPEYVASSEGRIVSLKPGKEGLKALQHDRGYLRVGVSVDGVEKHPRVHQLVALAFHGDRPEGMEVRHLDGDRTHNSASNLAYGTSSANQRDKVTHGTHNMARKTHCKRGHEFTAENTALIALGSGSTARRCRACAADAARVRRAEVAR